MGSLVLHPFHEENGARFVQVQGCEMPDHYGDPSAEYAALTETAALIDLSARGRLCLLGPDRDRFLQGQITNDLRAFPAGQGFYAALLTPKGKMVSDLFVYPLNEEILLDFEPGFTETIRQRLEQFVIADDVQIVDVAPHFGLLSIQGPKALSVAEQLLPSLPKPLNIVSFVLPEFGEIYATNQNRAYAPGFDLFAPVATLELLARKALKLTQAAGGRLAGWTALETLRIERGIPRFGADMDSSNLPPEAGIESRAISYTKGCYTGQEVMARLRSFGQVSKKLRGLLLQGDGDALPQKGDKIFSGQSEVGYITSATSSPPAQIRVAFGYLRRESNAPGTLVRIETEQGALQAKVHELTTGSPTTAHQPRITNH